MNKYEDKESAKDDYSHERNLRIDGRWEVEHGCKECGEDSLYYCNMNDQYFCNIHVVGHDKNEV